MYYNSFFALFDLSLLTFWLNYNFYYFNMTNCQNTGTAYLVYFVCVLLMS